MLSSATELQEIVRLVPEWQGAAHELSGSGRAGLPELFERVGAQEIYVKAYGLAEERGLFLARLRDYYYQPLLARMLSANQNLRRFWSQRRLSAEEQRHQALSFSVDLAHKMEGVLIKQLNLSADDGFRVLLPAYVQRTVHNAVVDYIRQEWSWEKQTLQDYSFGPDQEDPRVNVADDAGHAPESLALSREQVGQLNELRRHLETMLADPVVARGPLTVIDCLFGLGLTDKSRPGEEMTMRECCDLLEIAGETQARRIARCQVLLDKGLDMIRQHIRAHLPGIVEAWQGEVNVNSASRRELSQQLGLTEGEVERLVAGRQYRSMDELVERGVLKEPRLLEVAQKGAVAAFVPVDLNSCTVRDMADILGLEKSVAKRLSEERPFASIEALVAKELVDAPTLAAMIDRGAVLRMEMVEGKRQDLNRAELSDVVSSGVPSDVAGRIVEGRPFATWSELEEYLGCDGQTWAVLRQKFYLALLPG